MKITIGTTREGKNVGFDLQTLLVSRLLVQANSGAGKSYALRKLMEQLCGHIQVLVIDPEGEFSTLREKFPFTLVGKGGDAPAMPRTAALTAERLLELKASAVLDIYELKAAERHEFVKNFLEALIDSPKKLWHPCIVIVDEAHMFCPEKGAGESIAKGAMLDLSSKGRKRGFCAVWATQRLAKVDKDATSGLLNRLVGGTFEDVDVKRALDLLSVPPEHKHEIAEQLKTIDPGWFYAFGRAISKERVLFKVGGVETSHPMPGSTGHALEPPPPPEEIKKILVSLAELPQEAEKKLATEKELRGRIRELEREVKAVGARVVDDHKDMRHQAGRDILLLARRAEHFKGELEDAMKVIAKINAIGFDAAGVTSEEVQKALAKAADAIAAMAAQKISARDRELVDLKRQAGRIEARVRKLLELKDQDIQVQVHVRKNEPITVRPTSPAPRRNPELAQGGDTGELSGPEKKILKALGELLSIGKERPPVNMVAAWAGYSPIGGAFGNPRGSLRSKGLVDYPQPGLMALTDAGRAFVGDCESPDQEEIWRRIETTCSGPEVKILRALIDNAGQEEISKEDLAGKAGYSPIGGAFGNPIGALRTKGLLDYPRQGVVQAADWLFIG